LLAPQAARRRRVNTNGQKAFLFMVFLLSV
jgi:hypothetical protein